jgi:hypothetical protein
MLARPKLGNVELNKSHIHDRSSDERPESEAKLFKSPAVVSKIFFSAGEVKLPSPAPAVQIKNKNKENHTFFSENVVEQMPSKEPVLTIFDALAAKVQRTAIEDWVRWLESIQHGHN